jgi:tRNA(Ile2) C34 agmatinyltransferase TiaS
MQCKRCGGPLVELASLGNAGHFRCRLCGADQLRMTAATDVTTPTKTRQEIAIAIQNVLRWFRGR